MNQKALNRVNARKQQISNDKRQEKQLPLYTYSDLFQIRDDIMRQSHHSIAFRFFFKEKIKRFFEGNAIQIKFMDDKLAEFPNQYAERDEEGKPKTEKVNNMDRYVFKDKETEDKYLAEVNAFMAKAVHVQI